MDIIEKLSSRGYQEAHLTRSKALNNFIRTIQLDSDEKLYMKNVEKIIDYKQDGTENVIFKTIINVACVFIVYKEEEIGDAFFQPIEGFRFRTEHDIESLDEMYEEFLDDLNFIWESENKLDA